MWKGARLKNIHPLLKKVNYCCKVSTFKLCQGKSFKWCFAQVSLIFLILLLTVMVRIAFVNQWALIDLHAKWLAKQNENVPLPVLRLVLIFKGFCKRKISSQQLRKIVLFLEVYCKLAEICFYETINNELNTNNQTFEFETVEIKQSNIIANSNKENTDYWTLEQWKMWHQTCWTKKIAIKVAAADVRYIARSKFFGSLVHKKRFGLIWQVVSKLENVFCQG